MTRSHICTSLLFAALSLAACGTEPLAVGGSPNRTLIVTVGQELDIALQTVGPGEYQSPPTVSSPSVRFLDAAFVGPAVPAGPTQRFRFKAETPGQAIILFQHSGSNPPISDTVEVR